MEKAHQEYLQAIEVHDHEWIDMLFKKGLDPNTVINKKDLLEHLIWMYTRTDRFTACVDSLVKNGYSFDDRALIAVLLDDAVLLKKVVTNKKEHWQGKTYSFSVAYTPLDKASLLHICAEYNLFKCLSFLLSEGWDPDIKAGIDKLGFGGQTPIFHTVNQNNNASEDAMNVLLMNGANLSYTIKGLVWGKELPWETFIPSVNPISYTMMGLLPQMHRNELKIHETVQKLMKHHWDISYEIRNVPNKYLQKS